VREHHKDDGSLERSSFASFARWIEEQLGRSTAFVLAILAVSLWAVTGPFFGWSDTWQLVINTGTTIVTFLMVFVIQNTQNRDTKALQLKLDELIRVNKAARNSLMSLEEKSEPEVEEIKSAFVELASGQFRSLAAMPRHLAVRAGFVRMTVHRRGRGELASDRPRRASVCPQPRRRGARRSGWEAHFPPSGDVGGQQKPGGFAAALGRR
jgi:low affinity Fe/Cu permease